MLTGIDLGTYGKDTGDTLPALLRRLCSKPGLERVRISSIELRYVTDELLSFAAESPVLCPHFHIPLQSGSTRILRLMNRKYTAEEYIAALDRIREKIPFVTFTTDVLVGFPGETEEDFQETCRVVEEARFLKLHIFPYSAREGTAAAALGDTVPPPVKKKREKHLFALGERTGRRVMESFIGTIQPVLVERSLEGHVSSWPVSDADATDPSIALGTRRVPPITHFWMGYTPHYIPVIFRSEENLKNLVLPVRMLSVAPEKTRDPRQRMHRGLDGVISGIRHRG